MCWGVGGGRTIGCGGSKVRYGGVKRRGRVYGKCVEVRGEVCEGVGEFKRRVWGCGRKCGKVFWVRGDVRGVRGKIRRNVEGEKKWGEVWESVLSECGECGKACWGVGGMWGEA